MQVVRMPNHKGVNTHKKRKANGSGPRMVTNKPPRQKLRELRERAGISARQLSKHLGYSSTSGYVHYEQEGYQGDKPIPRQLITALVPFLRGRGHPAITLEELTSLADVGAFAKQKEALEKGEAVTVVEDGVGLLVATYRVEPGVFIRPTDRRSYGVSRIGTSAMYSPSKQFAALVVGATGVARNTQLHCVAPDEFSKDAMRGKRVVFGVQEGELIEVRLGQIKPDGNVYDADGMPVDGTILGVVIGSYTPE